MTNEGFNVDDNEDSVIRNIDVTFDLWASYSLISNVECIKYECVESLTGDLCSSYNSDT
jgi:hypothetical protein